MVNGFITEPAEPSPSTRGRLLFIMKVKVIALAALLVAAAPFVRAEEAVRAARQAPALTKEQTANHVTVKVAYKNPNEWRPVFEVTVDSFSADLGRAGSTTWSYSTTISAGHSSRRRSRTRASTGCTT